MKYLILFYAVMFSVYFLAPKQWDNCFRKTTSPKAASYSYSVPKPLPLRQNQVQKPKKTKKKGTPKKEQNEYVYTQSSSIWPKQVTNSENAWMRQRDEDRRIVENMFKKQQNKANNRQALPETYQPLNLPNYTQNTEWDSPSQRNYNSSNNSLITTRSVGSTSSSTLPSYYYSPSNTETYTANNTEYYTNETYSTTGKPKVKRNMAARSRFLRSQGYDDTPDGYEVDHIIPLSQGGEDTPENMQLLTKAEHRRKTARERASTSSTGSISTYFSTQSTPVSSYSSPSSTLSSPDRVIHTGSRGGQYYINSNGNKTYVKKH